MINRKPRLFIKRKKNRKPRCNVKKQYQAIWGLLDKPLGRGMSDLVVA